MESAFENFEIDAKPALVKRLAAHGRADDPVMPVQILARAVVVAQPMRRAEMCFRRYFIHINSYIFPCKNINKNNTMEVKIKIFL
jgi:hypothetical protein